ncbi:MAG: ABC transporter ATP-binding protein [Chloroflexota bacterium]|nr:MAG: ABC transporter ATP-binding protein [Chloroflexota bacterium]
MLLELRDVSKIYGNVHALRDVSLGVRSGEWVSIMGPSGSGKTTLLNIIGCMDQPSRGQVMLDGIDLSSLSAKQLTEVRRDKVGLVFQQFHLIPHLTAVENIMVAQYYHSMADKEEALKALGRVGLAHRAHHFPNQLSGGEQQRVCVARALINYPSLILADEPTGNLDEANEQLIVELFRELHRDGHTIIVVTHDQDVGQLADRQVRIEHGSIRSIEGTALEMVATPSPRR